MPRVRDLLYRFRPAGAPGAAGAAGVPVDRSADLAAELEPLFDLLTEVEQACAETIDRAEREAVDVRTRAAERAGEIVASARAQVDVVRSAAANRVLQADETGQADALATARRDATELRARAAARTPSYVQRVIASVDVLLGDEERVNRPVAGAR